MFQLREEVFCFVFFYYMIAINLWVNTWGFVLDYLSLFYNILICHVFNLQLDELLLLLLRIFEVHILFIKLYAVFIF